MRQAVSGATAPLKPEPGLNGPPAVSTTSSNLGRHVFGVAALAVGLITLAWHDYNSWGNFFEQFSLLTGAAIVYARLSSAWSPETLHRIGRILLGICVASFTLEQAIYLGATANL